MAGGHMKYRHLSRKSSHRQALLRNLVTSLFTHESISTTWHKAKEAQRLAEKLITLGKKNTEATRRRAHQIFYTPERMVPKLFGEIRERYANRPGGYTRVLRIEPIKEDQAESAVLELVDGPKDLRFHMTAKTLARMSEKEVLGKKHLVEGLEPRRMTDVTATNVEKVTRFRENGMPELMSLVKKMRKVNLETEPVLPEKRRVYPQDRRQKDLGM